MKRFLSFLFLVTVLGVLAYWNEHHNLPAQMAGLKNALEQSSLAQSITQDPAMPGPLRGPENQPGSVLSVSGVLTWTNKNRADNGGLSALKENSTLDAQAEYKLKDMFTNQYFEHISPDGKGPAQLAQQFHYDYVVIGENLALGNFKNDEDLLTAWMNSPGHRANILNKQYDEIGIAVGQGIYEGRKTWLAVQEFGKPKSDCPAVNTNLKTQIDELNIQIKDLSNQMTQKKQEIDSADPKTKDEVDAYNSEVAAYNNLVHIFNNVVDQAKQLTNLYNNQVGAFNLCAQG